MKINGFRRKINSFDGLVLGVAVNHSKVNYITIPGLGHKFIIIYKRPRCCFPVTKIFERGFCDNVNYLYTHIMICCFLSKPIRTPILTNYVKLQSKFRLKHKKSAFKLFFCWKIMLEIETYPCKLTPQAGNKSFMHSTTTYQQNIIENH